MLDLIVAIYCFRSPPNMKSSVTDLQPTRRRGLLDNAFCIWRSSVYWPKEFLSMKTNFLFVFDGQWTRSMVFCTHHQCCDSIVLYTHHQRCDSIVLYTHHQCRDSIISATSSRKSQFRLRVDDILRENSILSLSWLFFWFFSFFNFLPLLGFASWAARLRFHWK